MVAIRQTLVQRVEDMNKPIPDQDPTIATSTKRRRRSSSLVDDSMVTITSSSSTPAIMTPLELSILKGQLQQLPAKSKRRTGLATSTTSSSSSMTEGIGTSGVITTTATTMDAALESALMSLGRCLDLVRPAGTLSAQSVPREDWKKALRHLEQALDLIQTTCDPDYPLKAKDWGKLS